MDWLQPLGRPAPISADDVRWALTTTTRSSSTVHACIARLRAMLVGFGFTRPASPGSVGGVANGSSVGDIGDAADVAAARLLSTWMTFVEKALMAILAYGFLPVRLVRDARTAAVVPEVADLAVFDVMHWHDPATFRQELQVVYRDSMSVEPRPVTASHVFNSFGHEPTPDGRLRSDVMVLQGPLRYQANMTRAAEEAEWQLANNAVFLMRTDPAPTDESVMAQDAPDLPAFVSRERIRYTVDASALNRWHRAVQDQPPPTAAAAAAASTSAGIAAATAAEYGSTNPEQTFSGRHLLARTTLLPNGVAPVTSMPTPVAPVHVVERTRQIQEIICAVLGVPFRLLFPGGGVQSTQGQHEYERQLLQIVLTWMERLNPVLRDLATVAGADEEGLVLGAAPQLDVAAVRAKIDAMDQPAASRPQTGDAAPRAAPTDDAPPPAPKRAKAAANGDV